MGSAWGEKLGGGVASLPVIFHEGWDFDPVIWQNLLILAVIGLVCILRGIQLFKRTEFRKE